MGSPDASFGRRLAMVVLLGAVLPLLAVGLWTTRSAARSGRMLLQSQLEAQLGQTMRDVNQRWDRIRSGLLTLGENEPARRALIDASAAPGIPAFVRRSFEQMSGFNRVVLRDRTGRDRWTLEVAALPGNGSQRGEERGIVLRVPVTDLETGDTLGSIETTVNVETLIPAATRLASADEMLTAVFIPGRLAIVPPGADERLFVDEAVTWGGHTWLTARSPLPGSDVEVALAGALDPYLGLFGRTARQATAAVLVTSIVIAVLIVGYTRRLTRDVERAMAQREALATVGEFASELAHEVRNPLTAVRLDLQRVEEAAAEPDTVRGIVPRVLAQIERMDRAVTGALRVARGGSIEPHAVDLRDVLDAARRSAEPEFARRGARIVLSVEPAASFAMEGDAGALEQLFLNVFINAGQALGPSGEARVTAARRNGSIDVTIADNGVGMTSDQLQKVQQPFRSSRRDGTGLGLKIARRIVAIHRGTLEIQSVAGEGTTIRVTLPTT